MGDFLNNSEIFKKLGFDSSNQWMFYDERLQKFFSFLAENISDANVLTQHEVIEGEELKNRKEWLENEERLARLQKLQIENPGLFELTESNIPALEEEIKILEKTEQGYIELVKQMSVSNNKMNMRLSKLDDNINALMNAEKEVLQACQTKSKELEEFQMENNTLCQEATKCFTQTQSPPLFMYQMPLDQYFLKCESFMQYFSLYLKEHFKIQECIELEQNDDMTKIASKLDKLEKLIQHYTLAYHKEKSNWRATESLIGMFDISQIHIINIADMEREIRELQIVNPHLENTKDTLWTDLEMHVAQHTQQRMELILYENTKCKLERATRRHENEKALSKIISDALTNAELIWITLQLDMEKKRNRVDNTEQLSSKSQAVWQRIYAMRALQATNTGTSNMFLDKFAELLGQYLGQNVRTELKSCLYEYEKFGRLLSYAFQGMLNRKAYVSILEKLNELNRADRILRPLVFDSPVVAPMFEHVRYLRPIFNAKMQQQRVDKILRNLRTQFQDNITERMEKDKLWRCKQLLWIWFLTEPKRVLMAIEEVKKAASKVPSMTGIKVLGGIKRK